MAYECKIIADSVSPAGARITTLQVTFPRFVLAEMNTHRAFSRNYESSRAMSVERMIERVKNDPVIPVRWTAAARGMGNTDEVTDCRRAEKNWRGALHDALYHVEALSKRGIHKNIANRLLEPFSWVTGVITATDWENFFTLRCHADAQPEIRVIAEMMREAYTASTPTEDDIHLPYITDDEYIEGCLPDAPDSRRLSAARCARVSYGKPGLGEADLGDKLQNSGHWSPFEHQAIADVKSTSRFYNLRGWKSYRYELQEENG